MGDLLKDSNGANSTRATLTAAASQTAPLSEGMTTLVRGQQPSPDGASTPASHDCRTLRLTLLGADAVLTGGTLLYCLRQPAVDTTTLAVCALTVLLGAWLGWCGLRLNAPRELAARFPDPRF